MKVWKFVVENQGRKPWNHCKYKWKLDTDESHGLIHPFDYIIVLNNCKISCEKHNFMFNFKMQGNVSIFEKNI